MLSAAESELMDELYFVISFSDLKEQTSLKESEIIEALKSLVEKEFVWQMKFSEEQNDFDRTDVRDYGNIPAYHYLATKKGLMAHNSNL